MGEKTKTLLGNLKNILGFGSSNAYKTVVTDANGDLTVEDKLTGSSTNTDIKMNGTQSAGSSPKYAKADHVHPTDTSRAASDHGHTNYNKATYNQTLASTTTGAYEIGAITVDGNTTTIYGKDTNTVYSHPTSKQCSYSYSHPSTQQCTHNHDGTYLKSYTPPTASTSQAGIVQLNNTVSSTSTTQAATANAVKTAYDKGNHSHPYASSTHNHDGTYLKSYTPPTASTTQAGIVQLNSATNSTSTTQAATPSAVKAAYDLANGKPSLGTTSTTAAAGNHTHSNYLTSHQDISGKVDKAQGSTNASKNVVTDSNGNITTEAKPTIPTQTSQLTNNSGFLTSHQDISGKVDKAQGSTNASKNVVTDSSGNITTEAKLTIGTGATNAAAGNHTHSNYLTSHQDISGKVDKSQGSTNANKNVVTDSNGNITTEAKPTIPTQTSQLTNNSGFLTSHQDISGKVNIAQGSSNASKNVVTDSNGNITTEAKPTIPTQTSQLTNNSGFLTSHQDISGKENISNKVNTWSSTTTKDHYPSEKLVKDSLDGKSNTDHNHDGTYAPSSHNHTASNITDFLDKVYPVGAIYISVVSTSPATLFGGTWAQLTETFLYASTTADTGATATAGSKDAIVVSHTHDFTTGSSGSHNHTFTGTKVNNHSHTFTGTAIDGHSHTFTGTAVGNHTHGTGDGTNNCFIKMGSTNLNMTGKRALTGSGNYSYLVGGSEKTIAQTTATGGAGGFTPAGSISTNGGHTPAGTISSNGEHTPSGTISSNGSHTHTGTTNSNGNSGTNANMPPYMKVYMWKRTA